MILARDVVDAYDVLEGIVERTPFGFDHYLSEKYGATVYLKRENMQKVHSLKIRGTYYAIRELSDEEKKRGVVCTSAGNHAQDVAFTCHEIKTPATIFMPVMTPQQEIGQVKFSGGPYVTIKLIGGTFDASAQAAQKFTKSEGMTFIDPLDDEDVQAGQGTVAYEIYEQAQEEGVAFDQICIPAGGGGLVSGVATYIKDVAPETEVVGVEASGVRSIRAAFDKRHPVKLEEIDKFADGIAVQKVGDRTSEAACKYVDKLVGVDEGLISGTLIDMYSKQGIIAEPTEATSTTALEVMEDDVKGKAIVCIISGGNNDINRMQKMEERALIYDGVKHYFVINFPQHPGALREFVDNTPGPNDDIVHFEHIKRANRGRGPVLIGTTLSGKSDYNALIDHLSAFDPSYVNLHGNESLYNLLV